MKRTLIFAVVAIACAQTKVDYPTQVKNGPVIIDTTYATLQLGCDAASTAHATLNVTKQWLNVPTTHCNAVVNFVGTSAQIEPATSAVFFSLGYTAASRQQVWRVDTTGVVRITGSGTGSPVYAGNFTNFFAACDTASVALSTLTVNTPVTVSATTACAANVYAGPGGVITVNDTFTLTMNGAVTGDLSQHFAQVGSGTVVLSAPQGEISAAWFGASTGVSDNTSAFAFMMGSLPTNGATVSIPCGTFKGMIKLPQYPKSVVLRGCGQDSTIIQEPTVNSGIFTASAIVANFASGTNVISDMSLQAHAASTTSIAIDLRGLDRSNWSHISLLGTGNAAPGPGHFGVGIYCTDQTTNFTACYTNTLSYFSIIGQRAPTTIVRVESTAAVNTFDHFDVTGNANVTAVMDLSPGGPNNIVSNIHCEGNLSAVCIYPGVANVFVNSYFENNLVSVEGNGGSGNTFINSTFSVHQTGPHVICPHQEEGFLFIGVTTGGAPNFFDSLASAGCVSSGGSQGTVQYNMAIGSMTGGITTSTVVAPGIYAVNVYPAGHLAGGDYVYQATSANAAGESVPGGFVNVHVPSSNDGYVVFSAVPQNGAAVYNIYGRNCPGTCGYLYSVPAVVSNEVGLTPADDGTATPNLARTPPLRNSTGDVNAIGNAVIAGAMTPCVDTGASNNHLACTLPTDPSVPGHIGSHPWPAGFTVSMFIAHALVHDTNTPLFNLNGTNHQVFGTSTGVAPFPVDIAAGAPVHLTFDGTSAWYISTSMPGDQLLTCTAGQHVSLIAINGGQLTGSCD